MPARYARQVGGYTPQSGWDSDPVIDGRDRRIFGAGGGDAPRPRPVQVGGLFSSIKDALSWSPFKDVPGKLIAKLDELFPWQKDIQQLIWSNLPSEVRQLAIKFGPTVADLYLPGWGGTVAGAALAMLEGTRLAEKAAEALKKAQDAGQIPQGDLTDPVYVAALARAGDAPRAATAGTLLALAGLGLAGVFLLRRAGGARTFGRHGLRRAA